MSKKNKLAFGAIVGMAAGLVVGLFMVPRTNRRLRQMNVKAKVKQLKQNAKKLHKPKGKK